MVNCDEQGITTPAFLLLHTAATAQIKVLLSYHRIPFPLL